MKDDILDNLRDINKNKTLLDIPLMANNTYKTFKLK